MKRWYGLLIWGIGTLIAIAVIGENLFLGVGIAVMAGVLFGIVNFLGYKKAAIKSPKSLDV